MSKTKDGNHKRWVFQVVDGMLEKQIITGPTPEGWYELILEARMAATAPKEQASSPLADKSAKDAKAEIDTITDAEVLKSIVALDTRKSVTDAAAAKLASLSE
jgi:hypothetical protein